LTAERGRIAARAPETQYPARPVKLADRPAVAYVATFGLALVIVSPALADRPKDSFPLSTFPMFAEGRKDGTVTVDHALAIDEAGGETPIPPRIVGSDEVLQARATIGRAIKKGAKESKDLCAKIAARAATSDDFAAARTIELRTTKVDAVAWFSAEVGARPEPISMKRHATCRIERGAGERGAGER
jgi:hypothetical protein